MLVSRHARLLSAGLAALMGIQSLSGLLLSDQYRDVDWIRATWFGNDAVTLVVALPLLLLAMARARRGSVRGLLIWLGVLGYGVYNYAFYLFGAALNVFFLLYVISALLASSGLGIALATVDADAVAHRSRRAQPVRFLGGAFILLAAVLAGVWIAMWAAYAFAGRPTPVEPDAFRLVAALDLSLMVPVLVLGGLLLWRQSSWGYVIGAVAGIQAALYLLVLSLNSVVAIQQGLAEAPGELPIWGPLLILTSGITIRLLGGIDRQSS